MGVAFDAYSASHASGSYYQSFYSGKKYQWTHTPVGTPKGVLVFTVEQGASGSTEISSVTYGGVSMTAVSGGQAVDTTSEFGRVQAWFLGSGIPTGSQTVVVNINTDLGVQYHNAVCATVTAGGAAEVYTTGIVLFQDDGTYSSQLVSDGSNGIDSLRFALGWSGWSDPVAVDSANTTSLFANDMGVYGWRFARETTAGQGSRGVGFSDSNYDDRAAVHLAIREIASAASGIAARLLSPRFPRAILNF